jgi:hypothetical protein
MVTTENLWLVQGQDFQRTINLVDANNSPLQVNGYTANASFKIDPFSSNGTVYAFECALANGSLTLTMYANTTLTIQVPPVIYSYDAVITNGTQTFKVAEGIIQVDPGISIT